MSHTNATRRPVPQAVRRISTETKASVKTTELIAYVVVSVAVLIASAMVDARGLRRAGRLLPRHPADHRLHGQPRPGQVRQP